MREADTALDSRLAALLDIEEIRQLRMRYARCLDSGDFEGFDAVFAPNAIVSVTVGEMVGLASIKAELTKAYRQYDRDGRGIIPLFMRSPTMR
jgi:hypothetical protein